MRNDPVTCMLRVDEVNSAHVHLSMFVGRNDGARGHAGTLVLRTDEWNELLRFGMRDVEHVAINFEVHTMGLNLDG